ncbi:hypothetical protein [Marinobacter sp. ATCH36]|uniref:hypothetical protein n=1 Tax=Marinobacter sp. ATCH36 TaxID=2945106 RepID=UPI00201FD84F|nr:hypothetical protein [Marinobacter sp. ATCH36]MCL7942654.1 hypothetical protein [Marinobacter sp. ATCH36]
MIRFSGGVCRGLPKHFAYCKAFGKRYTGSSTEARVTGESTGKEPEDMSRNQEHSVIAVLETTAHRNNGKCTHIMVKTI